MTAVRRNAYATISVLGIALFLASCSAGDHLAEPVEQVEFASAAPQPGRVNLLSLTRPPIIAATDLETLPLARLTSTRTRWNQIYGGTKARRVSVESLPFIYRTAEGRQFLEATGPRAIARGMPAQICPATVTVTPDGPATLPDLAERALGTCIEALQDRHPDCGCRVLAIGDYLTVPREDLSYATGTTARMRIDTTRVDAVLVAEDGENGTTLLRDLTGPVALITRPAPDQVEIAMLRRREVFTGRSIPVGYRRGRIAERIYATGPGARRMSLLIGFSPDELAQRAAAYLAWPADG